MELKKGKLILSFIIPSVANLGIPPMHYYLKYVCFPFYLFASTESTTQDMNTQISSEAVLQHKILKAIP